MSTADRQKSNLSEERTSAARADRLLRAAALATVLFAFLGYFATQVWDSDCWWHLASGRWISAAHAVPDADPFGVYRATGARSETLLKGYWLAQVTMYLIVRSFGLQGIIFLKACLLVSALSFLFFRLRIAGIKQTTLLLVLTLAGLSLLPFTGERPQLFSFLFAALVFLLYERYRCGGSRVWLWSILPVMLVWANMHGAAVLGALLLAVHVAGTWTEPSGERSAAPRERLLVAAVVAASFALTLATPSGLNTWITLVQFEGSEMQRRSSEYMSPFRIWRQMLPFVGMLFLAMAAVPRLLRERAHASLAVLAVLAALSVSAARYVPFFVLVAGPFIARGIDPFVPGGRDPSRVLSVAALAAALFALTAGWYHARVFQHGVAPGRFPEQAVRRIEASGLHGRVFNHLDWGGYLLWYAAPAARTVIDGRVLDLNSLAVYTNILWATPDGIALFEKGGFDLVLLPPGNRFTGETYPLHGYLRSRPEWSILYADAVGALYGRGPAVP